MSHHCKSRATLLCWTALIMITIWLGLYLLGKISALIFTVATISIAIALAASTPAAITVTVIVVTVRTLRAIGPAATIGAAGSKVIASFTVSTLLPSLACVAMLISTFRIATIHCSGHCHLFVVTPFRLIFVSRRYGKLRQTAQQHTTGKCIQC